MNWIASDDWRSDEEFVPPEKHGQTKAETYTVEGYNARIRHDLARLQRKTKWYSKAEYRIEYPIRLLLQKR
jgi:insertion element IS1 protein InsB